MHIFTQFAYLDPGTGSMIIQSVIGIAAGVALFGRRAIVNIVHKVRTPAEPAVTEADPEE